MFVLLAATWIFGAGSVVLPAASARAATASKESGSSRSSGGGSGRSSRRKPAKAGHSGCKRFKSHSRKKKKCLTTKKRQRRKAKVVKPSATTPPAIVPSTAGAPTLSLSSPVGPILAGAGGSNAPASGGSPGSEGGSPSEGGSKAGGSKEPVLPPPVPSKPVNTVRPAISGTATQGSTLSANPGTWEGKPTSYAYQWQDCNSSGTGCADIAGETSTDYTLGEEDVGHKILVVVEATNAGGTTVARSVTSRNVNPLVSPPPARPTNTVSPTITGTAIEGSRLDATVGSWQGNPTAYAYQWQDCDVSGTSCVNVGGATASSYRLATGDVGHTMRVNVSATNSGGSTTVGSIATATVMQSVVGAGCTTTISSGLQSAIENAAAGSTICLDAGSYGDVTVATSKSSMVTITAAAGVSPSQVALGFTDVTTSSNLTFEDLTIDGGNNGSTSAPATHIHWVEDTFTNGFCIQTPTSANIDVLVESSTFINISSGGCSNEGRLEVNADNKNVSGVNGVVIAHDLFQTGSPSGCTDGVNITGGASGTVIGPGDEFNGLKQGSCAAHVDSIQFYGASNTTVTGDYFHGNSDGIMSPDGNGSPMTVTDTVFDTDGEYPDQIVIGGGEHDVISHDTFGHDARLRIGHVNVGATASNETITNNVLTGGLELSEGQSSSGWTMEYNLVEGEVLGVHSIQGKPVYTGGGSEPSTWAGWALTSTSPGHLAASDGSDMGTNYFGS